MIPDFNYQSHITFGVRMKRLWKQGKLPQVKKGLYGGELTNENVTNEHIVPKSKGGANNDSNMALATEANNNARGNEPIDKFVTQEQAEEYANQFKGIKRPDFDGDSYIKKFWKAFKEAISGGDNG